MFLEWLVRLFPRFQLRLDLGKKAVQGLGGGDGAFQGLAFAEGNDVLRRILETNSISGALRAQQFHLGGRERPAHPRCEVN
jgi:hypothetical protein